MKKTALTLLIFLCLFSTSMSDDAPQEEPGIDPRRANKTSLSFRQIREHWNTDFTHIQNNILTAIEMLTGEMQKTGFPVSEITPGNERATKGAGGFTPRLNPLWELRGDNLETLVEKAKVLAEASGLRFLVLENTDIRNIEPYFERFVLEDQLGVRARDFHKIPERLWTHDIDHERILFNLFGENHEPMEGLFQPKNGIIVQVFFYYLCAPVLRHVPGLNLVFGKYFPLRNKFFLLSSSANRVDVLHQLYHLMQYQSDPRKYRRYVRQNRGGKILLEMEAHAYLLKHYKDFGLSFAEVMTVFNHFHHCLWGYQRFLSPSKLANRLYMDPKGRHEMLVKVHKALEVFKSVPPFDIAIRVAQAKEHYWDVVGFLHEISRKHGVAGAEQFLNGEVPDSLLPRSLPMRVLITLQRWVYNLYETSAMIINAIRIEAKPDFERSFDRGAKRGAKQTGVSQATGEREARERIEEVGREGEAARGKETAPKPRRWKFPRFGK